MADITIDNAVYNNTDYYAPNAGIFWKNDDSGGKGYIISINSGFILEYITTSDGGSTWSTPTTIDGAVVAYDVWPDWFTPGDTGEIIHIVLLETTTDDLIYWELDTSSDTLTGPVSAHAFPTTVAGSIGHQSNYVSITKTRGGNVVAIGHESTAFFGFKSSTPGTATWTTMANPYESSVADVAFILPGNETDTDDLTCIFHDDTATELSVKLYDDSADSWGSETSIDTGINDAGTFLWNRHGMIRHSDNHLIVAAWSEVDMATADLRVWDIDGTSVTALTDVIVNTAEYAMVSVFINQQNDDLYISYLGGTTWNTTVNALYKKSTDGGTTWGTETTLSVTNGNHRKIHAGGMVGDDGGRFMPMWFNDNANDLVTNKDNSIAISAAGTPATRRVMIIS